MKRVSMRVVNRSAYVVRRRQPFLDWASRTPPDRVCASAKDLGSFTTVYLFSPPADPEEADAMVARHEVAIFAAELSDWTCDKSRWPEVEVLDLFHEWFEMDYADMAVDLGTGRIAAAKS